MRPVTRLEFPVEPDPRAKLEELLEAVEDTDAAAALFALIEEPGEPLTGARRRLLRELTAQDFGQDREAWLSWWWDNRCRGRFAWLLDGLLEGALSLRAEAAAQLRELTGETFGYHPMMSPRQREQVRREYEEWWTYKRWQADL